MVESKAIGETAAGVSFDSLARHYDWMEAVTAGPLLQRVRTTWIQKLADCSNVLSVGEGHGRFAEAFVAAFPDTRLTCVESSPGMMARGQRRVGKRGTVTWINASVLEWQPDQGEPFDAIVTCFFLDCFEDGQLQAVVSKLAGLATGDARWLNADFAVPEGVLRRWRARGIHALMYWFFGLVAGIPAKRWECPDALIESAGFVLMERASFSTGLLRTDHWRRI